jgi:transposase
MQQQYEVVYQSAQSYYELMHAAGLSYHKSQKVNPQRDEALVQERRAAIKKNWRSTGRR